MTVASYSPGDVIIQEFTLSSPRGSLDLSLMYATIKIFESIFVPNAVLQADIFDVNDALGNLNIIGEEEIKITLGAPGGTMASYTFALDTISNQEAQGSTKSKLWTLHGVGQETMYSKTNFVQKSYDTDISSIVQDIHSNFLMSTKNLITEATSGTQKILIPNYDPFKAIDMVRRRAVSTQNQSSTFLYFENALGMNFKTIEGMLKGGASKSFVHQDAVGSSIFINTENNIISYEVPQIASSTERVAMGGLKHRISTYNIRTRKYNFQDIIPDFINAYNSGEFIAKYGSKYGKHSFIPVDTANRPFTSIDTMTPQQLAYVANMMQNQVKAKVYGDAIVKAGDVVNLAIPEMMNVTGPVPLDPQISGNFLVSRLCRNVATAQEKPRYTESLECINGNLATNP